MRHWEFEQGGGEVVVRGRISWPDQLTVALGRKAALKALAQLAAQLADADVDVCELTFPGELREDSE